MSWKNWNWDQMVALYIAWSIPQSLHHLTSCIFFSSLVRFLIMFFSLNGHTCCCEAHWLVRGFVWYAFCMSLKCDNETLTIYKIFRGQHGRLALGAVGELHWRWLLDLWLPRLVHELYLFPHLKRLKFSHMSLLILCGSCADASSSLNTTRLVESRVLL